MPEKTTETEIEVIKTKLSFIADNIKSMSDWIKTADEKYVKKEEYYRLRTAIMGFGVTILVFVIKALLQPILDLILK